MEGHLGKEHSRQREQLEQNPYCSEEGGQRAGVSAGGHRSRFPADYGVEVEVAEL